MTKLGQHSHYGRGPEPAPASLDLGWYGTSCHNVYIDLGHVPYSAAFRRASSSSSMFPGGMGHSMLFGEFHPDTATLLGKPGALLFASQAPQGSMCFHFVAVSLRDRTLNGKNRLIQVRARVAGCLSRATEHVCKLLAEPLFDCHDEARKKSEPQFYLQFELHLALPTRSCRA